MTPYLDGLEMEIELESWPLTKPFRITGHCWESVAVLVVNLKRGVHVGRGEAAGVYYRNEMPGSIFERVESLRETIKKGLSRQLLQILLPPGPARNALDCALWDLEAKVVGSPAWQMAGLDLPQPLLTTFTCGADEPENMAATALAFDSPRAIKLKLTGHPVDADRVRAVRAAKPKVWIGIDANQGFSRAFLEKLLPVLVEARVALIEQPFPVGQEGLLVGFDSPIPIAADESAQNLADLPALLGRFQVVNIKLDKCGGLTEALVIARTAHEMGLDAMVGNMLGTSLSMAPAFLVGQLCRVVDLDGPALLNCDRQVSVRYTDGFISCPAALWGSKESRG